MKRWNARIASWLAPLLAALCLGASVARAAEAPSIAADPALEARVMKLAAELRCLVCQNQSIADSNAELAQDLRGQVREQFKAGRSEQQVIDYMTERYGDFVLYRPPFAAKTLLLWLGPALLVALAAWLLSRALKASQRAPVAADLSAEEAAKARQLLGEQTSPGTPPRGA